MVPRKTPWGTVQRLDEVAPGITIVETARHNGYHLSAELNAKVHECWRVEGGWYEGDRDWAKVVLTFPEHFTATHVEMARTAAVHWFGDQYAVVSASWWEVL